ncbi:hypothetical protein PRUPE_2G093600 [Prunus persica]|uniref:Wall-associated receptor kinase galacturonan-binding domain-containing protein n=1 Tax=Prunus persica TaxID=3760 RepID=A0A251QEM0_PRUPE|nr:hypothetical protein PRUPE_2G093600 [Prunus persica]
MRILRYLKVTPRKRLMFCKYGHTDVERKSHGIPSACGNIHNITYPFRLDNDPKPNNCAGRRWYLDLSCDNNLTVLHLYSGKFYVQAINYDNRTIRVVDAGIRSDNFSSIPHYSLAPYNFSSFDSCFPSPSTTTPVTFFKCTKAVNSSSMTSTYDYVKGGNITTSDLEDGCRIEWTTMVSTSLYRKDRNVSYQHIHNALVYGFELQINVRRFVITGL